MLALLDTFWLHQFSKFNNFLWVCWFLGKNLSNFKPLACKLNNSHYHTDYIEQSYHTDCIEQRLRDLLRSVCIQQGKIDELEVPKTVKDYLKYKETVVVYSGSRINESRADGTEDGEEAVGGGGTEGAGGASRTGESGVAGTGGAEGGIVAGCVSGASGGGRTGLDRLNDAILSTIERFGSLFHWIESQDPKN